MSGPQIPTAIMDDEDSTASSFTGSPHMNPTIANGSFDINYFLALANPDISSSSSESQSQGSRATSPSDWINMAPIADRHDPNDPLSWKFDTDALLVSGIDPNALILGEEQFRFDNSAYRPSLQSFQFEQPIPIREPMIQGQHSPPQLAQSQYMIPSVIEPGYIFHQSQRPHQAENHPFIHAPQPQHPVVAPPVAQVANNGAMVMDADAIGRRVRELAGIEYAVTASSQAEAERQQQPLALPQLPQSLAGFSQQVSARYTAPHSSVSPAPSSSAGSLGSPPAMPMPQYGAKPTRAKTSHTTIERRYRTNLNARIVALRHAVPALRILEKDKFPDEKADERGYVDGVKAARKASKGSILGKAAEYINVLKKREIRLRRDCEGLRALVHGLVGGPDLLAHWDRAWREQHPGDDEEEASDDDGDDEDGSDDDDDKPRKKPKIAPTPVASAPVSATVAVPAIPTAMGIGGAQSDPKRKRGRPRKTPLPPVVVSPPRLIHPIPQQQQQPPQTAKYLMGVFLLFTFLNPATSPATSNSAASSRTGSVLTSHAHKHVGTVLMALNSTLSRSTAHYDSSAPFSISWGLILQYAHALVTVLLFLTVAGNIVPVAWARRFPKFLSVAQPSPDGTRSDEKVFKVDLVAALERDDRGMLARALRCSHVGLFDALRTGIQVLGAAVWPMLGLDKNNHNPTVRSAVVRLAELDLMHQESMSIFQRLFHASRLYLVLLTPFPSSSELATLSLIAYDLPGARSFAASTWAKAQTVSLRSRDQRIIFDLSLDDAVTLYNAGHTIIGAGRRGGTGNGAEDGRITPLGLIASALVCERIRDKACELFTKESPAPVDDEELGTHAEEALLRATSLRGDSVQEKSDASLDEVVALGRSLTKPVRELTRLFEDVAAGIRPVSRGVSFMLDADNEDEHDALGDARSFLQAISLYRRISSATQPTSPTPSETSTLFAGSTFSHLDGLSASESSTGPRTPGDLDSDEGEEDEGGGLAAAEASFVSAERLSMSFGKASVGSRLALRRILGSSTFVSPIEINDARDRMVDFLVDTAWAH